MTVSDAPGGLRSPPARLFIIVLCFLALILELCPLLLRHPFYVDWTNHVWLINVFKAHLLQAGDFPIVINARSAAGNPLPLFYGFLFYPLMAVFSILFDADTVVRCAAASLVAAHVAVMYLFSRRTMSRDASLCVATIAVSSVYQMTNLYNRSALTEFFSYELFAIALSLTLSALWSSNRSRAGLFAATVGLLVLATGMHPPTAYAATLLVAPIALVFLVVSIREKAVRFGLVHGVALAGACCVMAPWVYVVWRYNARLAISASPDQVHGLIYLPTTVDSLLGKLGWIYIDRRTLADGIAATSTPFLNASLQVPLALLCLFLLSLAWPSLKIAMRWGSAVALLLCAITVDLSLRPKDNALISSISPYSKTLPHGTSVLHDLVEPLQFAYRLTNTLSLQMTIVLFVLLFFARRINHHNSRDPKNVFVGLVILSVIALSAQDVGIFTEYSFYPASDEVASLGSQAQLNNSTLKMTWKDFHEQMSDVSKYPSNFYGQSNYAMTAEFVDHDFAKTPMPWTLANFGDSPSSQTVSTDCEARCLIQTDLLPSAFIRPVLDGADVPRDEVWSISNRVAFVAPPGPHSVRIDMVGFILPLFRAARWIGVLWAIVSGAYCLVLGLALLRRDARRG